MLTFVFRDVWHPSSASPQHSIAGSSSLSKISTFQDRQHAAASSWATERYSRSSVTSTTIEMEVTPTTFSNHPRIIEVGSSPVARSKRRRRPRMSICASPNQDETSSCSRIGVPIVNHSTVGGPSFGAQETPDRNDAQALLAAESRSDVGSNRMENERATPDVGVGVEALEVDLEAGGMLPGQLELKTELKRLGKRLQWREAIALFRAVRRDGSVVLDNLMYSCIIGVVARSGRWSEAIDLLQQAERDGVQPNEFCFTAAVSACAKGRNWRLALSLLGDMKKLGLRPDHVTYGSAVSAMAKVGHWERALSLLSEMLQEGLSPNVVCYGAALDACAKGGQWERAVSLLEEMREAGVEPDRICYNTAIHACAQSGQWEPALDLADAMRRCGVEGAEPDAFTLNSVMAAMSSAGKWEKVLVLLDEMRGNGVQPDVVSYNTAMRACNEARQHQRALSIFAELLSSSFMPDQESFAAATEACGADSSGHHGNTALRLLTLARTQGLKPGARAVAATLAACVGGDNWRRAVPAVERMLEASGGRAWDDVFEFLRNARSEKGGRLPKPRSSLVGGGVAGLGDVVLTDEGGRSCRDVMTGQVASNGGRAGVREGFSARHRDVIGHNGFCSETEGDNRDGGEERGHVDFKEEAQLSGHVPERQKRCEPSGEGRDRREDFGLDSRTENSVDSASIGTRRDFPVRTLGQEVKDQERDRGAGEGKYFSRSSGDDAGDTQEQQQRYQQNNVAQRRDGIIGENRSGDDSTLVQEAAALAAAGLKLRCAPALAHAVVAGATICTDRIA